MLYDRIQFKNVVIERKGTNGENEKGIKQPR